MPAPSSAERAAARPARPARPVRPVRRIAVISGGTSAEHDVSVASAAAVEAALARIGVEAVRLRIERDGCWSIRGRQLGPSPAAGLAAALELLADCDAVYPMIHGAPGEDGALAALATLAGIRLIGSPLTASAVTMDKELTKLVAAANGVDVAPGRCYGAAELDAGIPFVRTVVVKPATAGSSHGVRLARTAAEFAAAIAEARRFDDRVLVEQPVAGREIDVAVVRAADGRLLVPPPLEIHGEGVFDSATKYDGSARFTVPAALDDATTRRLEEAARALFETLGCDAIARVDFFVTPDGRLVLNEINTIPGMTSHSQVPRMFAAAGVSYEELIARVVGVR
ncbi:D-alanine--D-alanine ligase [Agromyces mediolanus]|uniref:D-alanine--D-alanine ligase family protein n=1 Tax=Agromyces mediolanus TaxID=41986 RepID=UPI00203B6843|nr:D-alanine--D-alanine ligase [Agromyces mediolanus]MCM3657471.1 D-alanine--D-alanine ligase [Agromyces mediolanus]